VVNSAADDRLDQLHAIVDRYADRHPEQHQPLGYMTRLIAIPFN
jgi:hypothetical protein